MQGLGLLPRKRPLAVVSAGGSSPIIAYNNSAIKRLGRWNDTGSGVWTAWGGSQLVFKVSGTSKIIVFAQVTDPDTTTFCLMESYIDNCATEAAVYNPASYKGSNFYYLTALSSVFSGNVFQQIDLPDTGEHSVILHTNGYRAQMWDGTQKTTITGLLLDNGGVILPWAQGAKIRQTVGDSWNAADVDWPRRADRTRWELDPIAHGGLTSLDLATDYNYQYSGVSAASDPTAAVVSACEDINDYLNGVSTTDHQAHMATLLDAIRAKQPTAKIVLLGAPDNVGASKPYGSTYTAQNAAVVAGRSNVYYHAGTGLNSALSSLWLPDNAHVNGTGKQIVADDWDGFATSIGV